MNWGGKIALAYLTFVVLMVSLVTACIMQTDIFLVSDDYYSQELKYQNIIDQKNNYKNSGEKVSIQIKDKNLQVNLGTSNKNSNLKLNFFRPSNATFDKKMETKLDEVGIGSVSVNELQKGLWLLKLSWESNGKSFYTEEKIVI